MFTKNSKAIIYGLQTGAAQHMLDFDYLSGRNPSVSAFINPSEKYSLQKLFFGKKEILIPSFPNFENIPENIWENVDTLVNFASFRSAYDSTISAMNSGKFKNIIIVAEGIPERQTVKIIEKNKKLKLNIIGPATVGAMSAGIFRAGNTGGSLESVVEANLFKSGNVGFVSKSGGMSNELRRVIADNTNGTNLSVALGGDKHNIMTFEETFRIFEKDENTKMIVMLGEIGGRDELKIAEMIKSGEIKKPVVAWCIGTINEQISGEVQFGHAGAKSNKDEETASYKNKILKEVGAIVPESYMDFGEKIKETFEKLNLEKRIYDENEILEKLKDIKSRKSSTFTSSISDERGEELTYNKIPVSNFTNSPNIGEVIGQLWLKRNLPKYATDFINTVLVLIADHGPAVSGATNAIITSRAGNDIKSSLIAGLTTIGPRFGGAIDGAGKNWLTAVERNISAKEFVDEMKAKKILIEGIGHKVKSKFNPDKRCEILDNLSKDFPSNKYLNFAKKVEELTLEKKPNLILNVDGYIAAMLLDIFEDLGMDFEEKEKYVNAGIFNGLFLLGRSIGFIGHAIDQKILGEGLYRTSWDDILYV